MRRSLLLLPILLLLASCTPSTPEQAIAPSVPVVTPSPTPSPSATPCDDVRCVYPKEQSFFWPALSLRITVLEVLVQDNGIYLTLAVENEGDRPVTLSPSFGSYVVTGGKQYDLSVGNEAGDNLNGAIAPGVEKIGVLPFLSVSETRSPSEIDDITVRLGTVEGQPLDFVVVLP